MRTAKTLSTAGIIALTAIGFATTPVSAACKRMGFLVNDYGKEGPTNDAKALLDKSIAKEMGEKGIKTYKVGEKSVKCELFLNFIVFDEHTCTASANVCWDDTAPPKSEQAEANGGASVTPVSQKTTTGSIDTSKDEKAAKKSSAAKSEAKPKDKTSDAAESAAKSQTKAAQSAKPDAQVQVPEEKSVSSKSSREERYERVGADAPVGKTGN